MISAWNDIAFKKQLKKACADIYYVGVEITEWSVCF